MFRKYLFFGSVFLALMFGLGCSGHKQDIVIIYEKITHEPPGLARVYKERGLDPDKTIRKINQNSAKTSAKILSVVLKKKIDRSKYKFKVINNFELEEQELPENCIKFELIETVSLTLELGIYVSFEIINLTPEYETSFDDFYITDSGNNKLLYYFNQIPEFEVLNSEDVMQ